MTTLDRLARREPLLWLNPAWQPLAQVCSTNAHGTAARAPVLSTHHVAEAAQHFESFAPLLARLFPELKPSRGIIESDLLPVPNLSKAVMSGDSEGRWYIKGDHALPVAGSIKARGGIYEVLLHAESLALAQGILRAGDERSRLASTEAQELFAQHQIAVGSTGNLGLSIGVMAAALGFHAVVHMSSDAKSWKKERLRARGVTVIEHAGDFGAAVAAGREESARVRNAYFVDDEDSSRLFLGYAAAAIELRRQLSHRGISVDAQHPLFVYLPCGVGGAPGGITFGLRHLLGDHVHCFFAEPVASPSMLARLASNRPLSVREIGLDNRTEADGLAVARASEFVVPLIGELISGIFTVPDEHLFEDLYRLERSEGIRIEPSAAASFRGPDWLLRSEPGRTYLERRGLAPYLTGATHVLWTTGGLFVPEDEYRRFHERGQRMARGYPDA
jgi:D-serine dehydratase